MLFRFLHTGENTDSDNDTGGSGRVRFGGDQPSSGAKERPLDTEELSRGPLSGIGRLLDSPRVMQRITELKRIPTEVPPPPQPQVKAPQQPQVKRQPSCEYPSLSSIHSNVTNTHAVCTCLTDYVGVFYNVVFASSGNVLGAQPIYHIALY